MEAAQEVVGFWPIPDMSQGMRVEHDRLAQLGWVYDGFGGYRKKAASSHPLMLLLWGRTARPECAERLKMSARVPTGQPPGRAEADITSSGSFAGPRALRNCGPTPRVKRRAASMRNSMLSAHQSITAKTPAEAPWPLRAGRKNKPRRGSQFSNGGAIVSISLASALN